MAYRKEELSSEDLAAFDLLIKYLKETGQPSMNLREFVFNGLNDANKAYEAAKEANKQRDKIKDAVDKATAILTDLVEGIDPDDITLGQLNQEVSLERLIAIRRKLER